MATTLSESGIRFTYVDGAGAFHGLALLRLFSFDGIVDCLRTTSSLSTYVLLIERPGGPWTGTGQVRRVYAVLSVPDYLRVVSLAGKSRSRIRLRSKNGSPGVQVGSALNELEACQTLRRVLLSVQNGY